MTSLSLKNSLLALGVCAAALVAACEPNWMPDGYTYHGNLYKSANPPESEKFTAAQRRTMTSEQAQQFTLAANTLVSRLTARAGVAPKPVYLMKPVPMTPFYAILDNDLREALRHAGYTVSEMANGSYVYGYSANLLRKDGDNSSVVPNVHIMLEVYDGMGRDAKPLTKEQDDFFVRGAGGMNVQYAAFPETSLALPEPTGSARNYNE